MKVLLSIDGSKYSAKAVDYLIKHQNLFDVKNSELIVMHVQPDVIPPDVTQYISRKDITAWYKDQSKQATKAALAKLDKAGMKYKLIEKIGHVSDSLLAKAQKSKVDMIVMGSHGRSSLMSLIMGSVTSQVLSQAKQPVLIIK